MANSDKSSDNDLVIKPHYALFAGIASLVTVTVLIVAKTVTYLHTGSVSVLASLTDSVVDALSSIVNYAAIHYSIRPPDEDHRHGHGKMEGLAAIFQAMFIALAGAYLVYESMSRFWSEQTVQDHWIAIGVMAFAVVLSMILVAIQNRVLKSAPSLAVESEKAHYSMDILINGGVIVVLIAMYYGAPAWVDPVFALGVVVYLAFAVHSIFSNGINMLLDRELPEDVRAAILKKVEEQEGVLGVHDLRAIRSGMKTFISFDIEVDPNLVFHEAHEISRVVELALLEDFPAAEIMIHMDPLGDIDDSRHTVEGVHT